MTAFEKLMDRMVEQQIERVVLVGDEPAQLFYSSKQSTGKAISAAQLTDMIREIIPSQLDSLVEADGLFHFSHSTAKAEFSILVERDSQLLRIWITPEEIRQSTQPAEYPRTVGEAVDYLVSVLSAAEKESVATTPLKGGAASHNTLAMWIRNNLGLQGENMALLINTSEFLDPVEASERIVEALWQRLQHGQAAKSWLETINKWHTIDTFEPDTDWQVEVANETAILCTATARELGAQDSTVAFRYSDDAVTIEYDAESVKVVVAGGVVALHAINSNTKSKFEIFRVGSWIPHILGLQSQVEQASAKRQARDRGRLEKQRWEREERERREEVEREQERQQRYGRLPE